MAAQAELEVVIRARDQASRALRGIRGAAGRLGDSLKKLGRVAALGAAAGIVALGVAAIKFGSDFQTAFATIRKGTGAIGEDLEGLKQDFKNALKEVPDDMQAVATATADLNTRLGLTGKPLSDLTVKMLDFARATDQEVAGAIADTTRVFGDWSIATGDQSDALNHLFLVGQNTGIGVDKLAQQVVQFGAPLRQMGFSFEEATVLMGKWEKEGVNSEAILGALKIGVANFAKEGVDASTGLANFIDKITELGPGAEATSLAMETFGARAGPDMVAAVLEGRFAIEDLMGIVAGASDNFQAAAADSETWQQKLSQLKNRVLVKLEPLLTGLIEKLTEFGDWLNVKGIPLAEEFGEKLKKELQPGIDAIRDAFRMLQPKVKAAGDVLKKIFDFLDEHAPLLAIAAVIIGIVLVAAFVALAIAAATAAVSMLIALAPIIALVAVIALLVVGIFLLVKHWGTLTAFLMSAWEATMAFLLSSVGQLRDFFVGNFNRIKDFVIDAFQATVSFVVDKAIWLRDTVVDAFTKMKDWVIERVLKLKDGAIEKLGDLLAWVKKLPGRILAAIGALGALLLEKGKDVLRGLWDGLKGFWAREVEGWLNIKDKITTAVGDVTTFLKEKGKDIIRGLWNGMKAIWTELIGWLNDKIDMIPDFIKGFFGISSPSRLMDSLGRDLMSGLQGGIETGLKGIIAAVRKVNNALVIEGAINTGAGRFPVGAGARQLMLGPDRSGRLGVGGAFGGDNITINITLNGGATREDAGRLADVIEEQLRERSFRRG